MGFVIAIDNDSMLQQDEGVLTGSIHLDIGGHPFPSETWSDRIAVVLCRWIGQAEPLVRGDCTEADWSFEDASYTVHLRASDDGSWLLTTPKGVDDSDEAAVLTQGWKLAAELGRATNQLLAAARSQELAWTDDLRRLEAGLESFLGTFNATFLTDDSTGT